MTKEEYHHYLTFIFSRIDYICLLWAGVRAPLDIVSLMKVIKLVSCNFYSIVRAV